MAAPSYIHRYPEPLPHGRAIMRCDVVIDGVLVNELSGLEGSPAPWTTVAAHESKVALRHG